MSSTGTGIEVRSEVVDGVAVLTLSHPARRNAMNLELSRLLTGAVTAAVDDPAVGAVVVTGEPPAFCAGGDLAELAAAEPATLHAVYDGFLSVAACPLPTIAAVNGAAVGAGLNLALAADVRLAGPQARFDARFLQLGLHPGGGYTWMARRAMGAQGAAAVTLFGEILDAAEAERVGLVWRRAEDVVAAALELAGRAAAAPRELVRTTKSTLRITAGISHGDAVEVEVRAQGESVRSDAFRERLAALQASIRSGR